MSISGIRLRLRAGGVGGWMLLDRYPPLTRCEIAEIEARARRGEEPSKLELARVQRQSPIIDGELLMTARRGQLFTKGYVGIDLAEV